MKPELVDAAFRRKTPHKKIEGNSYDEPFLIDNFKALDKDDISDILMDISCSSEQSNNLDTNNVFFLDQSTAQGDFFNTNYLSPSNSVTSDNSLYSDYSANSLASPSYTINISLTDIESQMFNIPTGFYSYDTAEPEGHQLQELSLISAGLREESEAASDNDDCDNVRNNFDIETLVDECFMSQYSGLQVSVQS